METEYAIKISLTGHRHDNPENPYYWSIIQYDKRWSQIAFGWESSPEACFFAAVRQYEQLPYYNGRKY